jgi:hypothetical protein
MNTVSRTGASHGVDKKAIDQLIGAFFGIFRNTGGSEPNWALLSRICITEVLIIKKAEREETVYDLESFIEPRQKILSDGTLTGFEEREVEEETKVIGKLAQRVSRYQKSGYLNGQHFEEYGYKFFQLVKRGEDWKVVSLVWEDDVV